MLCDRFFGFSSLAVFFKGGFFLLSDDFGLSKTQKYNLGLLVNLLYNNPKVLYTPNGTAADEVIKKV